MYICRKKLRSQTSDLLLEAAAGQSDVSAERERERETAERRSKKKDPRARNVRESETLCVSNVRFFLSYGPNSCSG